MSFAVDVGETCWAEAVIGEGPAGPQDHSAIQARSSDATLLGRDGAVPGARSLVYTLL